MYSLDTKLSDILLAHPSVITMSNRFGIRLGVGDRSVEEICRDHDVNPGFFLMLINTCLNEGYHPEHNLDTMPQLETVLEYLEKTDDYYEHFQLPNIERHFNSLINRSQSDNGNLHLLRHFFLEMKAELQKRILADRTTFFPALRKEDRREGLSAQVRSMRELDQVIEERLSDLCSFFVIHLKGPYDTNLCYAVISAVAALKSDVIQNNRIRHRVLLPIVQEKFREK